MRMIDADELEVFPYAEGSGTEEQIAEWVEQAGLSEDDTVDRARELCWKVIDGFVNVVKTQPTLTPQNEPLTLETVAEILAEQFGDACACNVNGNDEWLPMMCHYGDVCPDPPEHLGCWMELLRNKYHRQPERQEDT